MMPTTDFDRLVTRWLEAGGPTDVRAEVVDHGLRMARTTHRPGLIRSSLWGPAAWPPRRGLQGWQSGGTVRLGAALLLVAALVGTVVMVGGRVTPPTPIVRPTFPPPPADAIQDYAGIFRVVAENGHGDTLTALPSGNVLLSSGDWRGNDLLELDVETGRYVDTGARLIGRRDVPTAIPLNDGRVLLIGGDLTEPDALGASRSTAITAELYDPASRRIARVGDPVHRTLSPAIVALPDGRVLVAGGVDPDRDDVVPLATAQLFDPVSGTFRATGSLTRPLGMAQAVVLTDGRVLVIERWSPDPKAGPSADLYDPTTGSFVAVASARAVPEPLQPAKWPITARGPLVALRDGRAAVVGTHCQEESGSHDEDPAITDLFDPATGTFSAGPLMPHCVRHASPLPNGEVFVAGYYRDAAHWSGLYDPGSGTVRVTAPPTGGPYLHVTPLRDGRILTYNEVDASIRIFE